jgi:DinB family protein
MKYMALEPAGRDELLARLAAMPAFLAGCLATLDAEEACVPGPADTFSPVEQCWHLADLEREGYGARMRRLREEREPQLPDFDGAKVAAERRYRTLAMADGLAAFGAARAANLEFLRGLTAEEWSRAGSQDGVGPVALCDLPAMMAEHDAAHRAEIEDWLRAAGRS